MNKYLTYLAFLPILASCNEENLSVEEPFNAEAVEIKGVEAYIDGNTSTRAAALDAYNYVGRSAFINDDQMVLTTIKRTDSPIGGFSYSGIVYDHVVEENQTSGGWNRDNTQGKTAASDQVPERIYWSDAKNGHTYIGYSVPQQETDVNFDWTVKDATYEGSGSAGIPVYYGSLGNPTLLQTTTKDANNKDIIINYIDYTNSVGENPVKDKPDDPNSALSYKSGNDKIQRDDILLTYDNAKVAETGGSVAKLYFHHGLAQVRVIVNIQGFSASSSAVDSRSVVSGMILKNMLTMYKWRQQSYAAEALDATYDATNISAIYGSESGVTCDQKKDVHLWIPRPEGTGTGVGKQFTFYALAVPLIMGVDNASIEEDKAKNLHFEFKVRYPDPMNPSQDVTKSYSAMMPNRVEFRAGYCTTINISLNHNNEQMTVGAEYMDWQLVETPDEGELKKNDTFLTSTARKTGTDSNASGATIVGDPLATVDDATWLYDSGSGEIRDIYGNNGDSEQSPYTICSADQLLSFAYEVNCNGRTFENKYVKLDANLYLQKSLEGTDVSWPGIGIISASQGESKAFNGTFLGGNRTIKRLSGNPFFVNIGPKGRVDRLLLEDVLGVTSGGGAFAELNQGVICASAVTSVSFSSFNVVGKRETITYNGNNVTSTVAGSMVGRNEGVVFACHSQGTFTTNAARVGGLVGYNTGALVVSYTATKATTTSTAPEQIYRGIVGYNDYAPNPLPTDKAANEYGSITYCFFDKDIDNNVSEAQTTNQVYPKSTIEMKKSDFIGENDRYALMSEADKTLLESLARKDYNILVLGSTTEELTQAETALRDRLLSTLDGTITYIAYHSYLCPKIINDAYADGGTGTSVQLQFLINHFLSHYYMFRVGDYPRVY